MTPWKDQFGFLSNKIKDIINLSVTQDMEKSINALLMSTFTKLELVSREEFDAQADLLRISKEKLDVMHHRLNSLEQQINELENLLRKNNKIAS